MDDHFIVTAFTVIDDLMTSLEHHTHVLAHVSDAEILIIALVASKFFKGNLEIALNIMKQAAWIKPDLSISRFNRRLHRLADWLTLALECLNDLFRSGLVYVIDTMPVPVCKRVRARRCRKVRGREFCGYCAAKREKFYGWRLHFIVDQHGLPVSFSVLGAAWHDLTAMHELAFELPVGSELYADKAFNASADEASLLEMGVRVIAWRKKNAKVQNTLGEEFRLRQYRKRVECVGSQLEAMGVQQIRARTNEGFVLKVHAALLAVSFTNVLALKG
jgi:Transposase DDE domain